MRIFQSVQFKKDLKRVIRRGKDIEKLDLLIDSLVEDAPLSQAYKDHALKSNWTGKRNCHIEPDWLVIYEKTKDSITLIRTGTHSDLF